MVSFGEEKGVGDGGGGSGGEGGGGDGGGGKGGDSDGSCQGIVIWLLSQSAGVFPMGSRPKAQHERSIVADEHSIASLSFCGAEKNGGSGGDMQRSGVKQTHLW